MKDSQEWLSDLPLDGARMLGAVRAANDCLQCHNGPRGRLLGAFSYEFRELK